MDGFDYGDPGSDPSSGGYDLNSWTGTGGMYFLPGEGGGERADTGLTVPTDDSGYIGETGLPPGVTPGTPGLGWNNPGVFGTLLADLQRSGIGGAFGSLFGGQYGNLAQMAAFGGLGALLNRLGGGGSSAVGYQGGIPKYTITRAQTPVAQQRPAGYRPGQGGITYFAPIQYNKAGYDIGSAPVAAAPTTGGTTGGSNVGIDTGGSVATPGYTGPVTVDGQTIEYAAGGYMPGGGIAMYAGGRYLRGPGDGVSDSIPAKFEKSGRPARLADGEFVIDARTVSEIGNGSSEAGARKLYAMMDRVHKARKTAKRGKPSGADKYLPK